MPSWSPSQRHHPAALPVLTTNLHHEIELVVAIGKAARTLRRPMRSHIYGYAVAWT